MTRPYRRSVKGAILSEAPASATGRIESGGLGLLFSQCTVSARMRRCGRQYDQNSLDELSFDQRPPFRRTVPSAGTGSAFDAAADRVHAVVTGALGPTHRRTPTRCPASCCGLPGSS